MVAAAADSVLVVVCCSHVNPLEMHVADAPREDVAQAVEQLLKLHYEFPIQLDRRKDRRVAVAELRRTLPNRDFGPRARPCGPDAA